MVLEIISADGAFHNRHMSRFRLSCDYYIRAINWPRNVELLQERCLAKYPRGVNLVYVSKEQTENTFTPNFLVDPGRIFLTYDRLIAEAFTPPPFENDEFYKTLKKKIETYNPLTTLLFLFVSEEGEHHLYTLGE